MSYFQVECYLKGGENNGKKHVMRFLDSTIVALMRKHSATVAKRVAVHARLEGKKKGEKSTVLSLRYAYLLKKVDRLAASLDDQLRDKLCTAAEGKSVCAVKDEDNVFRVVYPGDLLQLCSFALAHEVVWANAHETSDLLSS